MDKTSDLLIVNRTCTELDAGSVSEKQNRPLETYRDRAAYVLLGDPGSGKTKAFEVEARETNGIYITAREFVTLGYENLRAGQVLFIDALDEMPSGGEDSRVPFDQVRKQLHALGRPRFRLSCREADWLGSNGSDALKAISPDQSIIVLHLDPLTDNNILDILKQDNVVADPEEFVIQAKNNGLAELLRNPQTLQLMAQAARSGWPKSRSETYRLACRKLVQEINPEHQQAKRKNPPAIDLLEDAAGYMNAIQILSGSSGLTINAAEHDEQYVRLPALENHDKLPLTDALKTNLFQSDKNQRRTYIHRSVGEYLGARYLAKLIDLEGLPVDRVLALMTGEDGGIVSDLRGLFAWLSVHCKSARSTLIEHDPLGIVLYGDVKNFTIDEKTRVLGSLSRESQRYPWFRSGDWISSPFGAIATAGMEAAFGEILNSASRSDHQQWLLGCVLDALRYGEAMPSVVDSLARIARSAGYSPHIRIRALMALQKNTPEIHTLIKSLAHDIRVGIVEDRDDEILGHILDHFYPQAICPDTVLDFLHEPKARNLIGGYFMFWAREFSRNTKREDLPRLLDDLVSRKVQLELLSASHPFSEMIGGLLVRGLTEFGVSTEDKTLYQWLGLGLDKHGHAILKKEDAQAIRIWFEVHITRYKMLLEYGLGATKEGERTNFDFYLCTARFYGYTPPPNTCTWFLQKAEKEQREDLAGFFFHEAVFSLIRNNGQGSLIPDDLAFLEPWLTRNSRFHTWIRPFIYCEFGDWRQRNAKVERQSALEHKGRRDEWIAYFRQHLPTIRDGRVHPKVLHDLALAYQGLLIEAHGDTPAERLANFLDDDQELIYAAHAGFRNTLFRADLPSVSEIVDLGRKGSMHYIRLPCLVGMRELYEADGKAAMSLDGTILSRLVAFRLTDGTEEDSVWFKELISIQPRLIADVYVPYALAMLKARKEHVHDTYAIAYDEAYAPLSKMVLSRLLDEFPLRASKKQLRSVFLPLLKGALRYLDNDSVRELVTTRLGMKSLDQAQRTCWLCAGLILDPEVYQDMLSQYAGTNVPRKMQVSEFFNAGEKRSSSEIEKLPDSAIGMVVELLAPVARQARKEGGWVTPDMECADLVRTMIRVLGMRPTVSAGNQLNRLMTLPTLFDWASYLQDALHSNRMARRAISFSHANVEAVSRTLANLQPASASDLAALTFGYLREIARKIRDGSTNDYEQYWSYSDGNRKLENPKPENACRNALLSDLSERLGKLGIDAQPEGNYADNKRADIRVSFRGQDGFNVPIEIKKDSHRDLWRAMHGQLIDRYARDPGAAAHGVYVVLWFGGAKMPPPPDGGKRPRNAQELETRLRQVLTEEERHRIRICVIDCALPQQ